MLYNLNSEFNNLFILYNNLQYLLNFVKNVVSRMRHLFREEGAYDINSIPN